MVIDFTRNHEIKELGKMLLAVITATGINRKKLCRDMNITVSFLSNLISGKSHPSYRTVARFKRYAVSSGFVEEGDSIFSVTLKLSDAIHYEPETTKEKIHYCYLLNKRLSEVIAAEI